MHATDTPAATGPVDSLGNPIRPSHAHKRADAFLADALDEEATAKAKAKAAAALARKARRLVELHEVILDDDRMSACPACTWWREGDSSVHVCGVDVSRRVAVRKVDIIKLMNRVERLEREVEQARDALWR